MFFHGFSRASAVVVVGLAVATSASCGDDRDAEGHRDAGRADGAIDGAPTPESAAAPVDAPGPTGADASSASPDVVGPTDAAPVGSDVNEDVALTSTDAADTAAPVGGDGGADVAPSVDAAVDTAPPFVPGPVFVDVTKSVGIFAIQGPSGPADECSLGELVGCAPAMSGGVATGDFDGDGWPDLYVTRIDGRDYLYRNRGDGTFEDATIAAGLTFVIPSNGAGFADVDEDGDEDLYVTAVGDYRFYLFINDGNGVFTEEATVRGAAMIGADVHHGFSVSFGDFDRDGYLDLHTTEWRDRKVTGSNTPTNGRLLRNLGAASPGHFEDVTAAAGVSMVGISDNGVWGFASAFSDLDDDGWPDLAVVGDFRTSRLFWNAGDGTFVDGTDTANVGTEQNGMGNAIGDYDGDGRLDWFVTAIDCNDGDCSLGGTGNRLYRNEGARTFSDQTDAMGVRHGRWGWGAAFFDYDNDSDLDLVMTNGMALPDASGAIFAADPMRLWRNDGASTTEIARSIGLTDRGDGKGLLLVDYDRDGDQDLLVARRGTSPILYRNDGGNDLGWLRIRLGGTQSNREGVGAKVTVTPSAGGPSLVREVRSGSHFLGQSERVAHFGLGSGSGPVAEVRVRWLGNATEQVLTDVARNQVLSVVEP